MKMNKIICIYPEDCTTNFLMPIYESLHVLPNFKGYRCNTAIDDNKKIIIDSLNSSEENCILFFLGHGASNKLYGSIDAEGNKQILFDNHHVDLLNKFHVVGLACRSSEFLSNHIENHIGFGDITSDFTEVQNTRDLEDPDFLSWATEDDIECFCIELVDIFKNAIKYTQCKDLLFFYKILRLSINKKIANLLIAREVNNYRHIADMLYNFLDDITYSGGTRIPII